MCYDSIPCDAMAYLVNYNKKKIENDDDRLLLKEFQQFRKILNKNLFPSFR